MELVCYRAVGLFLLSCGNRRHHCTERRIDVGAVGQFDRGAVLARDQRTCMDCLALSEKVRMLLAHGLAGRKPLAGCALLCGCVADYNIDHFTLVERLFKLDGQGGTELFMTLCQSVLSCTIDHQTYM